MQIASAACTVQPSTATASRRSTIRSAPVSNSQLQSIIARRVCWRAGPPRRPLASRSNRSSNRSASSRTPSTRIRVAASSRASGIPSSRRQIVATAAALPGSRTKSGAAATVRATNSRTALNPSRVVGSGPAAGSGSSSGITGQICSPASPSGS
ncbi:hypothetical protein OG792_22095 [Micromonospora sp. NBC_01699]|uniref:hypothetical protein n=1 Tax=Micromonospora sp. NBC_01699 TaxID=2975984 RepID=UPI002E2B54BD|nr:hypothetical protein [Micromonospora sp. NBC_01699]